MVRDDHQIQTPPRAGVPDRVSQMAGLRQPIFQPAAVLLFAHLQQHSIDNRAALVLSRPT